MPRDARLDGRCLAFGGRRGGKGHLQPPSRLAETGGGLRLRRHGAREASPAFFAPAGRPAQDLFEVMGLPGLRIERFNLAADAAMSWLSPSPRRNSASASASMRARSGESCRELRDSIRACCSSAAIWCSICSSRRYELRRRAEGEPQDQDAGSRRFHQTHVRPLARNAREHPRAFRGHHREICLRSLLLTPLARRETRWADGRILGKFTALGRTGRDLLYPWTDILRKSLEVRLLASGRIQTAVMRQNSRERRIVRREMKMQGAGISGSCRGELDLARRVFLISGHDPRHC